MLPALFTSGTTQPRQKLGTNLLRSSTMKPRHYTMITMLTLSSQVLSGQTNDSTTSFSVSLAVGLNTPFHQTYQFLDGVITSSYLPGLFVAVGTSYGPVNLIDKTELHLLAELSYTGISTEDPNDSNLNSKMNTRRFTGMFWTRMLVPAQISPFVSLGAGLSNITLEEIYGLTFIENTSVNYLSFATGIGGGIDLTISNMTTISIFTQTIAFTRQLSLLSSDGSRTRRIGPVQSPSFGVRVTLRP